LQKGVSASPPKADIRQHERHVHYGPNNVRTPPGCTERGGEHEEKGRREL